MKQYLLAGALAIAALTLGAIAQVQTPSGPSTNSPVMGLLVSTNPTVGATCPSYNLFNVNATTADISLCVNGAWAAPRLRTGTASNTDSAGQITLSSGAGSYSFSGTYTSAPICTATDATGANAVKAAVTTTTLSLTGTSSDVINYVCVARN